MIAVTMAIDHVKEIMKWFSLWPPQKDAALSIKWSVLFSYYDIFLLHSYLTKSDVILAHTYFVDVALHDFFGGG
jgi:hypothetical protein